MHRTVDDTPYGGGPGMVMLPEPWGRALDELAPAEGRDQPRLVVPTPAGRPFTQALAAELAAEPWLLFACGRYEGIDARVVRVRRRSGCRWTRSASATTCWPAERRRCWSSPRRSAGCCPACSATTGRRVDDSFAAGPDGLLEAPGLHQAGVLAGPGRPAGAAVGQSRRDRPLAARAVPAAHRGAAPGPALTERRISGSRRPDVASSWGCPLRPARGNPHPAWPAAARLAPAAPTHRRSDPKEGTPR